MPLALLALVAVRGPVLCSRAPRARGSAASDRQRGAAPALGWSRGRSLLLVLLLVEGWGMGQRRPPGSSSPRCRWPRSSPAGSHRARSASACELRAGSSSSQVASPASRSCLAPAGPGRSHPSSSSVRVSASRWLRSPSGRCPAGRGRSCTVAGRSPHATQGSCSVSSCSRRSLRRRSSETSRRRSGRASAEVLDSGISSLDKLRLAG